MGILNNSRHYLGQRGQYLTFTAEEDETVVNFILGSYITRTNIEYLSYSTNGGITWTKTTIPTQRTSLTIPVTINAGKSVIWKGEGTNVSANSGASKFSCTKPCSLSGNIMSLLYGDDFSDKTTIPSTYAFYGIFNSAKITTAHELELPATTMTANCYENMFNSCTLLTTAPKLPATTLANSCYNHMFYKCSSLTTAPDLLATTLVNRCYNYMFYLCSSLSYIKAMFLTNPGSNYTYYWVNGVASSGTFVMPLSATWYNTQYINVNGIPRNWTVRRVSQ